MNSKGTICNKTDLNKSGVERKKTLGYHQGLLLLVCLTTLILGSAPLRGQSPPFTQAPPIGADTSAGILLIIDADGSLRVKTDPSQGPYDGIDDTLFAVQNNSANSIASIPLRGSLAIFAFDGDGIYAQDSTGAFIYNPPPGGPYGPTGYEGPGVSFSNISADQTAGLVNFNPPISPGGHTFFGLENAIQTLCPPINAPARLLQGDPAWATNLLGQSTNGYTIGAMGCYITSSAMLINYHAAKQSVAFRTDPAKLNQYLIANNGFYGNGAVRAGGEALIAKYARSKGVNLFYYGLVDERNDFTLDQYLCSGQPPILYVGNPHWVFATGQTTVNGTDTYSVLDPDSYPNGDTLQGWGYQYAAMELYSDIIGPLAGLYIAAHSPVELVLTDPNGAQTGLNPLTHTRFRSIPSSGYIELSLVNDEDHTLASMPPIKTLNVVDPTNGTYTLQVFGTDVGEYTIDLMGYDVNGNPSTNSVTGNAVPGIEVDYNVTYSTTPGSPIGVTVANSTPILTCPSNIVVEFMDQTGAAVTFSAAVTDACPVVSTTFLPPSGSLFPIGVTPVQVLVTNGCGGSAQCAFDVTVLGAEGVKSNVLSGLESLLLTATNRFDQWELHETICDLQGALAPSLWADQTHLVCSAKAIKVFAGEESVVNELVEITHLRGTLIPAATARDLICRIVKADRLLVLIAIADVEKADASKINISRYLRLVTKGDRAAAAGRPAEAIDYYASAWLMAERIDIRNDHYDEDRK